jgi:ribosome-binding protein aMBF1 (putative translation factor)
MKNQLAQALSITANEFAAFCRKEGLPAKLTPKQLERLAKIKAAKIRTAAGLVH